MGQWDVLGKAALREVKVLIQGVLGRMREKEEEGAGEQSNV